MYVYICLHIYKINIYKNTFIYINIDIYICIHTPLTLRGFLCHVPYIQPSIHTIYSSTLKVIRYCISRHYYEVFTLSLVHFGSLEVFLRMKWSKPNNLLVLAMQERGFFSYIEVTLYLGPQTHQDENLS